MTRAPAVSRGRSFFCTAFEKYIVVFVGQFRLKAILQLVKKKKILPVSGGSIMIDFFKKLMEQALDLKLTVRLTERGREWFAALGEEPDSFSLEELEEYRTELEARLCDMDNEELDDMVGDAFKQWVDAHESPEDLLSEVKDRVDELM